MKRLIIWLTLTIVTPLAVAQNLDADLSNLFVRNGLQGFLGQDHMMMDFRFDSISKLSNSSYRVQGLSRAAMRLVRPFEGELTIDSLTTGAIFGRYKIIERDSLVSKYGEYTGNFTQYFIIENSTPRPSMADYTGEWTSVRGSALACNWSSSIVEAAWCPSDFFDGSVVAKPYRKYGWESVGCDPKLWKIISPQFNLDWIAPIAHDTKSMYKIEARARRRNRQDVGEVDYRVVDGYMVDDNGEKRYEYLINYDMILYVRVRGYTPGAIAPVTLEREKGEDIKKRHNHLFPLVCKDGIGITEAYIEGKR